MVPQFEDALNRLCFACQHPVRKHTGKGKCACCAKGTVMPSEAIVKLSEVVRAGADEAARRRA